MYQLHFQLPPTEEHREKNSSSVLPSAWSFLQLCYKSVQSDIDSFQCPCLKGWGTFSFWFDVLERSLCSEVISHWSHAWGCILSWRKLQQLHLQLQDQPMVWKMPEAFKKDINRGIYLWISILIMMPVKNEKEEELVWKSKRTARSKQTNITF